METKKWREFRVGDLFNCKSGKIHELAEEPSAMAIPYYTATERNNGFAGYVEDYDPNDIIHVPSLTVGSRGNDAITYFHEGHYIANQNLSVLIPKYEISMEAMLFVATIIRAEKYKYTYGRLMSQEKVRETRVLLPATLSGTPDWRWMENYIKSLPYSDRL